YDVVEFVVCLQSLYKSKTYKIFGMDPSIKLEAPFIVENIVLPNLVEIMTEYSECAIAWGFYEFIKEKKHGA
ncbi:MAG: hypothetical protein ACK5LJ_16360, partial [Paracoccus sp. (in: a-proteobacteria)]